MFTLIKKNKFKLTQQFLTFSFIGFITAGIYFSLLYFLHEKYNLNEITSVTVAFFVSAYINFIINKIFTFGSIGDHNKELGKFIFVLIVNYFATIVIVKSFSLLNFYNLYIASIVSIAATTFLKFILVKYYVFNKAK